MVPPERLAEEPHRHARPEYGYQMREDRGARWSNALDANVEKHGGQQRRQDTNVEKSSQNVRREKKDAWFPHHLDNVQRGNECHTDDRPKLSVWCRTMMRTPLSESPKCVWCLDANWFSCWSRN